MWKGLILYPALMALFFPINMAAQQQPVTASEALRLFKDDNFTEAGNIYSVLLERNDRDLTLNYYYGICLYKTKHKFDEAIRRLKFSSTRPVSGDVYFYLGKLYQQIYELELAIENLERFRKHSKPDDPKYTEAQNTIEECKSGLRLINKYFDLQIIGKDTVARSEILNYYFLSKDAGQIMPGSEFFRTGVDPNQIIFRTERGSEVFFPIMEADQTWNLYKIVRLLDSWNEAESLGESINTKWDELYPFLLIDGVTLYFSSNKPGGMGGFDIYQSLYEPESRQFSTPSNLGPPFNSPDDDYFLVPDVFAGKAWFATNRGLDKDKVIVVETVWDDNVIKNNTESIHQLRTLASLPDNPTAMAKSSTTLLAGNENNRKKVVGEINFIVNDTLKYTRYDQFLSNEALVSFKSGFITEQRRDSLSNLMANKRKAYSLSYSQTELKQLIDEIVVLEKQTYGLDDEINRHYLLARRLEQDIIKQMIKQGTYRQKVNANQPKKSTSRISELEKFNLKNFSFYTDDDFNKRIQQLNNMYINFFTKDQIARLQQSDSLYFWGNVLSLESAKLLEKTRNLPSQVANPFNSLKNVTEERDNENPEIAELIHKSREMKRLSLDLYDEALTTKFKIYYPTATEFISSSKQTGSEYMLNQANSNFRKAEEGKASLLLNNTESRERLISLKKLSVEMLEESFNIQAAGATVKSIDDHGNRFYAPPASVTPAGATTQKNDGNFAEGKKSVSLPLQTGNIVHQQKKIVPEYKIQIGAFRNEPNKTALAKIPPVTSVEDKERGLIKYFSGSWRKFADAQAMVQTIRDAGFPGAFVVSFLNGEPILLDKAKLLEEK